MDSFFEDADAYGRDPLEPAARSREEVLLDQPLRSLELRSPLSLDASRPASEAIRMMREHRNGSVLVTSAGVLVGIFTERDVLTRLALGERDPAATPLAEVMRPDPETLTPDDPMVFALNVMSLGGFRHIPLVGAGGVPMGVVSVRDIVNHLVDHFPDKVLNLPPRPGADIANSREGA
ncbi:MAG: CBS domain-containing protein [Acidobacteriota bacterium]